MKNQTIPPAQPAPIMYAIAHALVRGQFILSDRQKSTIEILDRLRRDNPVECDDVSSANTGARFSCTLTLRIQLKDGDMNFQLPPSGILEDGDDDTSRSDVEDRMTPREAELAAKQVALPDDEEPMQTIDGRPLHKIDGAYYLTADAKTHDYPLGSDPRDSLIHGLGNKIREARRALQHDNSRKAWDSLYINPTQMGMLERVVSRVYESRKEDDASPLEPERGEVNLGVATADEPAHIRTDETPTRAEILGLKGSQVLIIGEEVWANLDELLNEVYRLRLDDEGDVHGYWPRMERLLSALPHDEANVFGQTILNLIHQSEQAYKKFHAWQERRIREQAEGRPMMGSLSGVIGSLPGNTELRVAGDSLGDRDASVLFVNSVPWVRLDEIIPHVKKVFRKNPKANLYWRGVVNLLASRHGGKAQESARRIIRLTQRRKDK